MHTHDSRMVMFRCESDPSVVVQVQIVDPLGQGHEFVDILLAGSFPVSTRFAGSAELLRHYYEAKRKQRLRCIDQNRKSHTLDRQRQTSRSQLGGSASIEFNYTEIDSFFIEDLLAVF